MDMGFHQAGERALCGIPAAPGRVEWHGLVARLLAGQALRQAAGAYPRQSAAGSFDADAAQRLAGFGAATFLPVNPIVLADGKPDRAEIAPAPVTSIRRPED